MYLCIYNNQGLTEQMAADVVLW